MARLARVPRLTKVTTIADDLSRADAQMLVLYRDARARDSTAPERNTELFARVQAIVDDFAREAAALGRLSEAKITFDAHTLPMSTRVAQV